MVHRTENDSDRFRGVACPRTHRPGISSITIQGKTVEDPVSANERKELMN